MKSKCCQWFSRFLSLGTFFSSPKFEGCANAGSDRVMGDRSMRVIIEKVELPSFGRPKEIPEIPPAVYEKRIERLMQRMAEENYDAVVVYADREHSANISWLTGFDPRFEEALFVLTESGQRTLIVGNECSGVVGALPIRTETAL